MELLVSKMVRTVRGSLLGKFGVEYVKLKMQSDVQECVAVGYTILSLRERPELEIHFGVSCI